MKTIIAIICIIASMFATSNKPIKISDVYNTKLYAMGARCVSVENVDDKIDVVTVENCNGYQFTFEAPRYDFFEGDKCRALYLIWELLQFWMTWLFPPPMTDMIFSSPWTKFYGLFFFAPMFLYARHSSRRIRPPAPPEGHCIICTTGTGRHYAICTNSNFSGHFYFFTY